MKGFKQWIIDNSYFDGETIDKFKFKNNYDLAERYAEEQVKDSSLKALEELSHIDSRNIKKQDAVCFFSGACTIRKFIHTNPFNCIGCKYCIKQTDR